MIKHTNGVEGGMQAIRIFLICIFLIAVGAGIIILFEKGVAFLFKAVVVCASLGMFVLALLLISAIVDVWEALTTPAANPQPPATPAEKPIEQEPKSTATATVTAPQAKTQVQVSHDSKLLTDRERAAHWLQLKAAREAARQAAQDRRAATAQGGKS